MFKRSKTKRNIKATRLDTLIGQHTRIVGNVSFNGGLRVDGHVKGHLSAGGDVDATLTLSESGSIEGNVHVPNLIVDGVIKGDVFVSGHVELATKAKVQGNVYYRLLEMAMGAEVNGQLIRVTTENEHLQTEIDMQS